MKNKIFLPSLKKNVTALAAALLIFTFSSAAFAQQGGVSINENVSPPHQSAGLDVDFTNKGFLPPRMTTAERDAIANPADGLEIFNTSSNCINYRVGTDWLELCGTVPVSFICSTSTVTFTYKGSSVTYGTVESNTDPKRCWLDRNLGATQVAASSTDANSYGDLFQWGRLDDGHQERTSGTTTTLSNNDIPVHDDFIINPPNPPLDWRSDNNDNRWNASPMVNNPCPSGWRVPTEAELNAERSSWGSNNSAGAFASPLKLPMAGNRNSSGGSLFNVGTIGLYWSSTVSSPNSRILRFSDSDASMISSHRAPGYAVRCIKD